MIQIQRVLTVWYDGRPPVSASNRISAPELKCCIADFSHGVAFYMEDFFIAIMIR